MTQPRMREGWVAHGDLPPVTPERLNAVDPAALDEDMIQIVNAARAVTLDVGWYPAGDVTGRFICQAVYDDRWDEPFDELQTQDSTDALSWLEEWMERSEDVFGADAEISDNAVVSVLVVVTEQLETPQSVSRDDRPPAALIPGTERSSFRVEKRKPEVTYAS